MEEKGRLRERAGETERETGRQRARQREREKERAKERMCVSACSLYLTVMYAGISGLPLSHCLSLLCHTHTHDYFPI